MKQCTRCDINKPATAEYFYRDSQRADGLHPYCKSCRAAMHREYLSDPDTKRRVNKKIREWQKGAGREKYMALKREYDKSEKRRAWRHERTRRAIEGAKKYVSELNTGG